MHIYYGEIPRELPIKCWAVLNRAALRKHYGLSGYNLPRKAVRIRRKLQFCDNKIVFGLRSQLLTNFN